MSKQFGNSTFRTKLKDRIFRSFPLTRKMRSTTGPIVSFTFDDAPVSAARVAGNMLSEAGVAGTFYISMGLSESESLMMKAPDIEHALSQGHEIGCHTFGHSNLRWASGTQTRNDCSRNCAAIEAVIPGTSIISFSYPFGSVGIWSGMELSRRYQTLRTTEAGINCGAVDLDYLRANRIYSREFDKKKLRHILEQTVLNDAWTIFYTHDVCDDYSNWGTSTTDFDWLFTECLSSGIPIKSVGAAAAGLSA